MQKHESEYKDYRKLHKKKVAHEAETIYYKELFDTRKNSVKKLRTNLNKVCSFKKNWGSSNCIKKIVVNNTELTDLYNISNGLNSFLQLLARI